MKKNYRISAPKEEEEEFIKETKKSYRISAPKLATSVSQHQPLLQRGKDIRAGLKPKEEPNEVFIVVRQGRVLPSNRKTIYRRKHSRKHATTKEADFGQLIRTNEKISSYEGSLRSQPKWKIKETSKVDHVMTTVKATSSAIMSSPTTAKNQPTTTTTTTITITTTTISSKTTTTTTLQPKWKNKETEKDEARWETRRKEKVD